ncbi:MAG: sugar transferase [Chloroflexi bacterium]|nr:sugar transferase [Chloroflexota bacterium]
MRTWRAPRQQLRRGNGGRYRRAYLAVGKRLIDVAICLPGLLVLLPVMLLIALAVWVDSPGPVVFAQRRTGKGGRRFTMYKFRTMVHNAEELKARYAHLNELTPPDFKITNDPRVTRVGRWLRKTSLDELPQLFSVVKGDMTLVGPRPTSFAAETYRLWHTGRLEAAPGLTGLWQISGRSKLDFDDRVRLDIAYVRQRSLGLDLKILVGTAFAVVRGEGAC